MTNEVKRSLGQKTRLFLGDCCFCGLLGRIHPEELTILQGPLAAGPSLPERPGRPPSQAPLQTGIPQPGLCVQVPVLWAVGDRVRGPPELRPCWSAPRPPWGTLGVRRASQSSGPAGSEPHLPWDGVAGMFHPLEHLGHCCRVEAPGQLSHSPLCSYYSAGQPGATSCPSVSLQTSASQV